jgi:hypothetical protein
MEHARLWYEPHLERIHEDAETRRTDLVQLEQIAASYASRQRFLTELTLDPPDATSDHAGAPLKDEDYLILSTIHSTKGQEWKSVFALNVVDGCIPSDLGVGSSAEIEEERRRGERGKHRAGVGEQHSRSQSSLPRGGIEREQTLAALGLGDDRERRRLMQPDAASLPCEPVGLPQRQPYRNHPCHRTPSPSFAAANLPCAPR